MQTGYKPLKQSGFKATKTDKDGGFALTTAEELTEARIEAVKTHHYKRVALTEGLEEEYFESYRHVCRKLANTYAKDHQHTVYKAVTRDLNLIGMCGFFSKLLFTVKTHNSNDEVVTCNVHTSTGNPFRPLMRTVVSIVEEKTLGSYPAFRACEQNGVYSKLHNGLFGLMRLFSID